MKKVMQNDTIAAISTALSNGAVSIVRVSGENAIVIVNEIFKGKDLTKVKSHTIHYGHIVDEKEVLDEVLVSVFKSPKTFTKEDVVEINCHGGVFVTNRILELLLVHGARLADPGEFTKRAFLNGRIDLTQAEAVMDMISSQTTHSLKMANYGLNGETSEFIRKLRNRILECMLKIEVNIDYPEYEDEEIITQDVLFPELHSLLKEINQILEKSTISQVLQNGIKTAIIGRPNVGKSSLLNALLREDKAIVTNIEGTTRDLVEGSIRIGGVVLHLIDTAGIRKTSDYIEQIGVEKTNKVIENAELVLLVLDNSRELNEVDLHLLDITKDKNRIVIVNKKDLDSKIDSKSIPNAILISSYQNQDIEILENKIKEMFHIGSIMDIDPSYIGNARQISKLKEAKKHLEDAISSLNEKQPVDIANIDIHHAWISLGEILGEVSSEELLDELFSRFCLGK